MHQAHHLGTTREVVARQMGEFVAARLLDTQRGLVSIRDLFGLRRVVAPDPASGARKVTPPARRPSSKPQ